MKFQCQTKVENQYKFVLLRILDWNIVEKQNNFTCPLSIARTHTIATKLGFKQNVAGHEKTPGAKGLGRNDSRDHF